MSYLLKYIDFILEASADNSSRILYSIEFRHLLSTVGIKVANEHKDVVNIARILESIENRNNISDAYTLVDVTDKNDTVSMSAVSRIKRMMDTDTDVKSIVKQYGSSPDSEKFANILYHVHTGKDRNIEWVDRMWTNQRTEVKVGRYAKRVAALGPAATIKDSDLEIFVNIYKSSFDYNKGLKDKLELVKGEDIRFWYLENNYVRGGGALNNSCMRHEMCQDFFDIYTENPEVCQLLILKDENNKLLGRALVWTLSNSDKYMDRVYTSKDSDVNLFKEYAKDKNWLSYSGQSRDMIVNLGNHSYDKYPYMDTFTYYNTNTNKLANNPEDRGKEWIELQSTNGGSSGGEDGVWSEWEDCYLNEDEAIWCENVHSFVHSDNATWLEYKQEYAAGEGIVWSDYNEEAYFKEDAVWSICMNTYLHKKENGLIKIKASKDKEDYCIVSDVSNKYGLYIKIGDQYFDKWKYLKNPYTDDYMFLDDIIDGITFKDFLKNKSKEEGIDNLKNLEVKLNNIKESLFGISSKTDNIITNYPKDAIEYIRNSDSFKKFTKKYERVSWVKDKLTPEDAFYYILLWPTDGLGSGNGWISGTLINQVWSNINKNIPTEIVNKYKQYMYSSEMNYKNDNIDYSSQRNFIVNINNIATEFDYNILGDEYYKLFLFLKLGIYSDSNPTTLVYI